MPKIPVILFFRVSIMVDEDGGMDSVRVFGLFESSLNAPFQSFGGTDVFPSIHKRQLGWVTGL